MIPQEIVDKIIQESDIVEVLSDFMQLAKRGRNYIGLCPFHNEKTPSFNVSLDKQIYKCFGCGKAGSSVNFVMEITGLNYPDTLRYLANKFNIFIPEENQVENKDSRKDLVLKCLDLAANLFNKKLVENSNSIANIYLTRRDFHGELKEKFILGYAPESWDFIYNELKKAGFNEDIMVESGLIVKNENGKVYDRYRNRLIFPIKSFVGKIIGFGGRDISDDKNVAKYINSSQSIVYDKSKVLYALYEAKGHIRLKDEVILVEGYADVLTMHKEGFINTVASCGTALTLDQLLLVKRYTNNLYILYDNDNAGQNASEKALELAIKEGFNVKVVVLDEGEDPDSYLRTQGKMLFKNKINNALNFISYKVYLANKKSLTSPQDKSNLINELVGLVKLIPDKLQHEYYLEEIIDKLKLSAEQKKTVYDIFNKNNSPKRNEHTLNFENKSQNNLVLVEKKEDSVTLNVLNNLKTEELLIIKAILEDIKYYKLVIDEYRLTAESFITESAKILFDTIIHSEIEDSTNPLKSLMNSELTEDKTKELLSGIALYEMEASDTWKNFANLNLIKNWDLILKDSIAKLILEHKIMEQQNLKSKIMNLQDINEKLILLNKLNQINTEVQNLISNVSLN
jgi:DNA primase